MLIVWKANKPKYLSYATVQDQILWQLQKQKLTVPSITNAAEFFPRNYQTAVCRKWSAQGGGVLVATKNGILVDEVSLEASTSKEIACVRFAIAKSSLLHIATYYRSPSNDTESLDSLQRAVEKLADITRNSRESTITVAGDLNARDIYWDNFAPTQD